MRRFQLFLLRVGWELEMEGSINCAGTTTQFRNWLKVGLDMWHPRMKAQDWQERKFMRLLRFMSNNFIAQFYVFGPMYNNTYETGCKWVGQASSALIDSTKAKTRRTSLHECQLCCIKSWFMSGADTTGKIFYGYRCQILVLFLWSPLKTFSFNESDYLEGRPSEESCDSMRKCLLLRPQLR